MTCPTRSDPLRRDSEEGSAEPLWHAEGTPMLAFLAIQQSAVRQFLLTTTYFVETNSSVTNDEEITTEVEEDEMAASNFFGSQSLQLWEKGIDDLPGMRKTVMTNSGDYIAE